MKIGISLAVFCIIALTGSIAVAEQKGPDEAVAEKMAQTVVSGCKTEIETYCKNVTVGQGRVLACLYAYEDKLQAECVYALYDAIAQLEYTLSSLVYTINECRDDLTKFCSNIKFGEGRVLQCLDKNSSKISSRCKQALKDTGLK